MKTYPSIPHVSDAPDGLLEGHLWLVEKVDGAHLRFQLRESGAIRFGGRNRVYGDLDAVPEPYQHAVRHVRATLDRDGLRNAVDDVEDLVFFGEAMHRRAIDYDWERTPSFLGFDVWSAEKGRFYPVDTVERIFDRLGLRSVNVFERERRARDFDPDSYTVPQSAWYDGPAAGVVVRNKRGGRAQLLEPSVCEGGEPSPVEISAEELASKYATPERFDRLASELEAQDRPVTFEALYERILEDVARAEHERLYGGDATIETKTLRSEIGARTRRYLGEEG